MGKKEKPMKHDTYLELKADLLVEGVWVISEALGEVGKKYKEQNHGLFGWDFEDHVGIVLPDDFLLPDGTVVQFRKNSRSPYCITLEKEDLVLFNGDERICSIELIPRPGYYRTETTNGHTMVRIGQVGGK